MLYRRVVRPWLGFKMLNLNDMIIAQLKERDVTFPNVKKGLLVAMVTPGSPADRAGFHPGDLVIEFDGTPVESIKELFNYFLSVCFVVLLGERFWVVDFAWKTFLASMTWLHGLNLQKLCYRIKID
ncbi:hypothetical protein SLA2020_213230 [Shorea laevis]